MSFRNYSTSMYTFSIFSFTHCVICVLFFKFISLPNIFHRYHVLYFTKLTSGHDVKTVVRFKPLQDYEDGYEQSSKVILLGIQLHDFLILIYYSRQRNHSLRITIRENKQVKNQSNIRNTPTTGFFFIRIIKSLIMEILVCTVKQRIQIIVISITRFLPVAPRCTDAQCFNKASTSRAIYEI